MMFNIYNVSFELKDQYNNIVNSGRMNAPFPILLARFGSMCYNVARNREPLALHLTYEDQCLEFENNAMVDLREKNSDDN